MKGYKTGFGFTLIELLVVIAIIGVLSTFAIIALGSARQKARDVKRLADLNQIGKALEVYYANNNIYPTVITPGQPLSDSTNIYIEKIPSNPTPRTDGGCPSADYQYYVITSTNTFRVGGCLGNSSGTFVAGPVAYQTGAGMLNCGGPITDRDGYIYQTIQIGGQCWMAENLKTKTKPDGSSLTNLSNGSERDCVSASGNTRGVEADCTNGRAIYTWAAAMNGSSNPGAQGICPDGWHIPTDAEANTLDQYLVTTGNTCNSARSNYGCLGAGTKILAGGSSGFNGLYTGQRSPVNAFTYYNALFAYWTSTQSGLNSYSRAVWSGDNSGGTVYRGADDPGYGISLRCLKN